MLQQSQAEVNNEWRKTKAEASQTLSSKYVVQNTIMRKPSSTPFLGGVSIDPGLLTDISETLQGALALTPRGDSEDPSLRIGETI